MNILILEASTSSAKAMVFNSESGVKAIKSLPYPPQINDTATQDADGVVKTVLDIGRAVSEGYEIDAISPCSTWHSLLVCDRQMQPQSRIYSWQYRGAKQTVNRLLEDKELVRQLYQDTGCMVHSIYPVYQMAHLRENGLDTGTIRVCGQGSYLYYRLTGKRQTTPCMVSGSAFLNVHTKDYNPMSMELAGIKKEQLSELCASAGYAPLREDMARLLGVKAGIPVLLPNADGAMNQVGSLAGKRDMTVSIGTSAALRMNVDSSDIYNSRHSTWMYLSPHSWMLGAATSGACNCVDWFMQRFGCGHTYNELAEKPADKEKLPFFLPFLYGERCPGWDDNKLGGFFEVGSEHSVHDLYQSILEGVLFNVYQCYREICAASQQPKKILISGGILNSPQWLRTAVNIFGRELVPDSTAQASMTGAAYLALETLNGGGIPERAYNPALKPEPELVELYRVRYRKYQEYYNRG